MTGAELEVARRAALAGGAVLKGRSGLAGEVRHKGFRDLVSELDLASQERVVALIRAAFPDHHIWAEEDETGGELSGPVWLIDPLDGTTNFVHGLPAYCVSVALSVDGELVVGAIYDPERDELFSAAAGQGAWLGDTAIAVSKAASLAEALLVTGFPYDVENHIEETMLRFRRALLASQGVRRLGSAAMDLAYVACGRMDAFWEAGLKPWDMAAGALIVREAGGAVSDLDGGEYDLLSGRVLASNGRIHDQMIEITAV